MESAFDGINYCLMAYGQTGSGKTHTVLGENNEKRGILPRFGEELFNRIREIETNCKGTVTVTTSFFEIYNENCYDLLFNDIECDETLYNIGVGKGGKKN